MLCHATVRAKHFPSAQEAVSAVEFAMIFPALLTLMVFGTQIVLYINAVRKVERLASSMAQMLSEAVPPSNATTTGTVNAQDLHFAFDSGLVVFPYLMEDSARKGISWSQDIQVDFASIQFTQIATTCSSTGDESACYTANVVWTSSGTDGVNYRPCVTPQLPASNTASPSRLSLPTSIFGPGSILAVDVVFTFAPTFGAKFMSPLRIARSIFIQPRYASLINFDTTNNDGIAVKCPGY